jgi:hypothetical protein
LYVVIARINCWWKFLQGRERMDRRRVGASGDARAIAKKADLFHFLGAVRLHLVAAFLDAQSAVMVPF